MRVFVKIALAGTLVVGSVVSLGAAPAGAATVVTVVGNQLTLTMTGTASATFSCSSGSVKVNDAFTSPTLACSALTKVTATGDGGLQWVYADALNAAAFSSNPWLSANLGAGTDYVAETDRADAISLGAGTDTLILRAGGLVNASADLGPDDDATVITGTDANETFAATSTSATATINMPGPSGAVFQTVSNTEDLEMRGYGGNDVINATSVSSASSIDETHLDGGPGNDTVTASPVGSDLAGRDGTNILIGGNGNDEIHSGSSTDDLTPGKGFNTIYDEDSLHAGGRSYHPVSSGTHFWDLADYGGDAVVRVRQGSTPGSYSLTTSLNRFGQQLLPSSFNSVLVRFDKPGGEPDGVGLADLVVQDLQKTVAVFGDDNPKELVDVTVPSGSWTTSGTLGGTFTVNPAYPGGPVSIVGISTVSVHGPWTDANQGFAHRVIRDLQLRFAGATERDTLRDQLAASSKTRPQVVAALMDTDLYRGLDVDRVFLSFLRRTADPGGRTYWINSLDSGKPLIKFRAQLFGSNEYFTKAGATNASYMVKAYNDVLGRQPDPSGQAYWTNKLDNGADRGAVALQFLASTEARRNIVKDQFLRFLDRYPTDAESTTWVSKLAGPTGEQDLVAFLASSSAYANRT